VTTGEQVERDLAVQGEPAGAVTRLAGYLVDVVGAGLAYSVGLAAGELLLSRVTGDEVKLEDAPLVASAGLAVWTLGWFSVPVAAAGRTVGGAIVGLRVARVGGRPVGFLRALLRAAILLTVPIGGVLVLLRRDRRALHDLATGTGVRYHWDARSARLRRVAGGQAP
jgi:uncharacterized RDD family membrane protein YckC